MPKVSFTYALKRFFPELDTLELEAKSIGELLNELDLRFPGIKGYFLDSAGDLRKHVNIFIGENRLTDKSNFDKKINSDDHIYFMQALSGG